MKRIFGIAIAIMFMTTPVFAQNNTDELPQESRDFINEHFATENVSEVDVNDSWYNITDDDTYEVRLRNGMELEFDSEGRIKEIESDDRTPIPHNALPEEVRNHLQREAPNANVVKWEKDGDEHEIELDDGTEMEIDRDKKSKHKKKNKDKNRNNNY